MSPSSRNRGVDSYRNQLALRWTAPIGSLDLTSCAPCPHNAVLLAYPPPSPYSRGGNFARPAMSAAVSIALWAGAGLTISALLAAIAVALNRRTRTGDPGKATDF